MLLISSIISEKKQKRNPKEKRYSYNKKVEDKMEELNRQTIIDYYMNGGI